MPPGVIGFALLILSGVGLSLTLFTHRWDASRRWKIGVTCILIAYVALSHMARYPLP